MHRSQKSQAGFSLVAILVVMSVVLFSIMLISQAKVRQQRVQKALKVKQSYSDVNQTLINNVVQLFHESMTAACLAPATVLKDQDIDGTAKFSYTTSIVGLNNTAKLPPVHALAAGRCKSPKIPAATDNRFYFCVQINPPSAAGAAAANTAPKDSILGAKVAFAEFAVELIDLQTEKPITCADYTGRRDDKRPVDNIPRDGSAGMAVTMALYWENQAEIGASTFSQKALSYIANQN